MYVRVVCLKCVKTRIYLGMKKRDAAALRSLEVKFRVPVKSESFAFMITFAKRNCV